MDNDTEKQPDAPVDTDAEALAAMDDALGSAPEPDENEYPEPAQTPPEPKEGDTPQEPKADDKPPEPTPEQETASLNLKGRAAERFTALAATKAEYEPYKAILTAEGVKDAAELQQIIARRKDADYLIEQVAQKVGTPEVFGNLLDYAEAVNKARSGDQQAAAAAYDMVMQELPMLAKMAGKVVPGVDALKDHADLIEAVETGGLDRKHAEELAAARGATKFQQERRTQTQEQAAELTRQQQAGHDAIQQMDTLWGQQNPRYAEIRPELDTAVRQIRATYPPGQWGQMTAMAYAGLVQKLAPAAKPVAGAVPMRPAAPRNPVANIPDDPYKAFDVGYDQAIASGY